MNPPDDVAPREFHGPSERIRKGLLIVYTGEGKGKTTAAFGMVFRALGRGYKVAVVQFMKGPWVTGEIAALERFGDVVEIHRIGEGFTWETKDLEKDKALARRAWDICLRLLRAGRHDLYLFDELVYVLKYRFLPEEEVLLGLRERPPRAHVVLTGRDASPALVAAADLVTEMKEVKHPFREGIVAQPGVDY
jgi:cob(I)alamin adenosyltransferase